MPVNVKENFIYSSILTVSNYIFPLLVFPYISRVLGVANIGICNFVDSIINYFILLSMLGINIIGIREIARVKKDREELNIVFSSIFLLNTITTFIALIVLFFTCVFVEKLNCHMELMIIGGFKIVFNYILVEWLYRGLEEFSYITQRTILVKVLYVLSVFIFIKTESDYPKYYILSTLVIFANAIINILHSRRYVSIKFKSIQLFKYTKSILIMGSYSILTYMYTTFNISFLGFSEGDFQVGLYTTSIKLFSILLSIYSAFTGVMMPRMSAFMAENDIASFKQYYHKSILILLSLALPLIIWGIPMASDIVKVVSGDGYDGAIFPMRIILPLIFIVGYEQVLVLQTLTPLKKEKQLFVISGCGALGGILLNLLLVPGNGCMASAIVWLISETITMIIAQYYVKKYIKEDFPFRALAKHLFFHMPLLVLLCLYAFYSSFDSIYNVILSFFLVSIYVYFLQCHIIKNALFVNLNKLILKKLHFR